MDLKIHQVPNKSYALVKINVQLTERSKTVEGKDLYDGFVVLKVDGSIRGAFCPRQGGLECDIFCMCFPCFSRQSTFN